MRFKVEQDRLVFQLTSKQMKLEQMYKELRDACSKRRIQLVDDIRYHSFVRQVDDLSQWLEEKAEIAKQDNYGRDLEDCQCLVGEFDQVMKQLTSAGERVAAVQRCQEELLRNGHPYSASIRAKGTDLQQLWVSVNETANERQQALQGAIQVHKFDQDADETLGWLEEKEAHQVAMEGEDMTHADLPTLKQLMIKHDEFMHGVAAVEKQVTDLSKEAERLVTAYPDTKSHLEVRRIQMEEQLKDVTIASRKHLEKLDQMQNLQSYFQEHRDLIAWIRRLQHTITSEVLPLSVEGCEALMLRHNEYQTEISGRQAQIDEFIRKGRSMIASQHVLSVEISAKIDQLIKAYNTLKSTWNERSALYQENHDLRLWQHDADKLDGWLTEKECMLSEEWRKVENVEDAESRIRNFDDFLITLDAQEPKFEALKRLTLLEKAFSAQRKTETERLDAAKEAKRRETIKTFEKTNKLQDRRKERERRMTQEVSLLKPNPSFEDASEYSTQVVSQSRRVTAPVPPLRSSFDSRESAGIATPTTASHLDIRGTEGGMKTPQSVVSVVSGEEVLQRDGSARRTPRFTTRRSNSLRKLAVEDETGSVDMYGYLDRKHDLQTGGKKATVRTWKRFYTILCGQLLCFFKDENAFRENSASSAPVNILNAECNICPEYLKKKNTFRLKVQDGSEYLFSCTEEKIMLEWIDKIRFHAALTPSQQLRSFDQGENPPCRAPPPRPTDIGRRHTTEVAASSPVRSHSTSDPVSPTQESSSAQADVYESNTLPRPVSLNVGAFASLPRHARGFVPTHYPHQASLSAVPSSSPSRLPAIVKPSLNGSLPHKSKTETLKHSLYESVYGEVTSEGRVTNGEIRINGIEKGYASPTTRPLSCSVGAQNTHDSVETKVKLPSSESMRNRDSGSVSPLRYANRNDGTDFIAWVESQGNLSTSSTVSSSQNDDTGESVKGKKSKFSY
ncbi:hypothetical protein AB6A40_006984 [Gnathostoma spinigerum]|uniref:PH domain-containing protein n=1 Tax=Gnathostoma spinigerum TaxID=75299 RepID=A0ABD6EL51_9BILA